MSQGIVPGGGGEKGREDHHEADRQPGACTHAGNDFGHIGRDEKSHRQCGYAKRQAGDLEGAVFDGNRADHHGVYAPAHGTERQQQEAREADAGGWYKAAAEHQCGGAEQCHGSDSRADCDQGRG